MRTKSLLLILLFCTQFVNATEYDYAFLVEFSDKTNSVYSIERPNEFLSQRAIDRRLNQNIEIIEQDLPINSNYVDSIVSIGGVFHISSKWMNSAVFYTNDVTFENQVKQFPFVSQVSLVFGYSDNKSAVINNKFKHFDENQKSTEFDYGDSENQIEMCNGQVLHDQGFLGGGIQVAVLDAGFLDVDLLTCFDYLRANDLILGTHDFVTGDSNAYVSHSHGRQVLSVLASNDPGVIFGTAPQASYWLLRTEDANSEFRIEEENWIAGAEFADSAGVDIISSSLGYSSFDNVDMNYTYEDMDGKTTRITKGAEVAFSKGIVIVNSAGNEGVNKISAPSDGENTLCIGAVDADGNIAEFSSRGPSSDGRVKPDVSGQGQGTNIIGSDGNPYPGNGTSFSCPLIAGLVTCLWEANPTLSNEQIIDVVRRSGDIYKSPDDETGYGIPDFSYANFLAGEYLNVDSSPESLLNVYPNPFFNEIVFDFVAKESEQILVELFDHAGKLVYSKIQSVIMPSVNRIYIDDLGYLSNGIFILVVKSNASIYRAELVKE